MAGFAMYRKKQAMFEAENFLESQEERSWHDRRWISEILHVYWHNRRREGCGAAIVFE